MNDQGAVIGDAEETLRYLIGKLGSGEQFDVMALEIEWTMRMASATR